MLNFKALLYAALILPTSGLCITALFTFSTLCDFTVFRAFPLLAAHRLFHPAVLPACSYLARQAFCIIALPAVSGLLYLFGRRDAWRWRAGDARRQTLQRRRRRALPLPRQGAACLPSRAKFRVRAAAATLAGATRLPSTTTTALTCACDFGRGAAITFLHAGMLRLEPVTALAWQHCVWRRACTYRMRARVNCCGKRVVANGRRAAGRFGQATLLSLPLRVRGGAGGRACRRIVLGATAAWRALDRRRRTNRRRRRKRASARTPRCCAAAWQGRRRATAPAPRWRGGRAAGISTLPCAGS